MAYLHAAVHIIVLSDNPINPVQEPPIVVGEVPDNNTDNLVVGKIPDDNRLVFLDSMLEFVGVKLMERFPGFTILLESVPMVLTQPGTPVSF